MGKQYQIGIRYCGGCNPHYDRVAFIRRLSRLLPQCELITAIRNENYAALLVVCGCTARCAGVSGLDIPRERWIYITGGEDITLVSEQIKELLDG